MNIHKKDLPKQPHSNPTHLTAVLCSTIVFDGRIWEVLNFLQTNDRNVDQLKSRPGPEPYEIWRTKSETGMASRDEDQL